MEFTQGVRFDSLGLLPEMTRALEKKNIEWSTPVQAGCIPPMREWKDVIAKAPTGTGKTMALGIPIIEKIDPDSEEVQAVIIYVNAHYMDKLTLDGIADYVGLNREYLSRLFSKETGTGLFQYINEVRMKRAGEMIRSNKQVYIKEVAAAVGFDDPYFFSRKFKDFYGKTPSEYAEG